MNSGPFSIDFGVHGNLELILADEVLSRCEAKFWQGTGDLLARQAEDIFCQPSR